MIFQGTITFLFKETEQFQGTLFHMVSLQFGTFLSCVSWIKKKLVFIFPITASEDLGRRIIQHNKAISISGSSVIFEGFLLSFLPSTEIL